MAKIIEAVAKISATDATGAVFDKIAAKIEKLGKSAKTSEAVDKLTKAMNTAQAQMKAIDKFDMSRGGFANSHKAFRDAQLQVEQTARAMAGVTAPTREMEQAYRRAQRTVSAASRDFERQKAILISNKRAVENFGIPIGEATAHQHRLRQAIERTNTAISKQGRSTRMWDHGGVLSTGAAVAAGYVSAGSIGRTIGRTVAAGAHYQHEVTGLQNVGRTPQEIAQIDAASRRAVAAVPTSTFTDNLKVINETTGAFGSLGHAIENLEFMQKASSVVHSAAGDKISDGPGEMGNKLARFFEMRGTAGDAHTFQSEAEQMVKAMVFTRGNFNPNEMLNFGQQAKGALQNYDMAFLGRIAPSLVTEMGGDRAGTGANAWRNTLMGKVRDQKQTAEWTRLGLLDPKLVSGGKGGAPQSWRAGAVKDTDLALKNPLEWTEKTLIPALQKSGVNVDDPLDLSKALGTMFRNQNANQFAEQITQLRARTRLHKDDAMIGNVHSQDEMYANNLKTDPTQAWTALTASLNNLATVAISPAMQTAAHGIDWAAETLQSVALFGHDHPALAMGTGAVAAGGALWGASSLTLGLMNGFGLSTSAAALDGAAAALTAAATRMGTADLAKGAVAPTAAGAVAGGLMWPLAVGASVVGIGGALAYKTQDYFSKNPSFYEGSSFGELDPNGVFAAPRHGAGASGAWDEGGASGSWGGKEVKAELTGSAEVTGETTVKVIVEPSGELLRAVAEAKEAKATMNGRLNANGPGSAGHSSPDSGSAGQSGSW